MPIKQRELADVAGVSVRTIRQVLYSEEAIPVVRILHMIVGKGRKKLKITAIGDYGIAVRRVV